MTDIDYNEMIHSDTIFLNLHAEKRNALFNTIASRLKSLKYVNDSYLSALEKREDQFPTGLISKYLTIALPHADPINVNKPFLAIAKNYKTIDMRQMGNNEKIATKYFFFLGITNPSYQVILLKKFVELLRDKNFCDDFKRQKSCEEMYDFLKKSFL